MSITILCHTIPYHPHDACSYHSSKMLNPMAIPCPCTPCDTRPRPHTTMHTQQNMLAVRTHSHVERNEGIYLSLTPANPTTHPRHVIYSTIPITSRRPIPSVLQTRFTPSAKRWCRNQQHLAILREVHRGPTRARHPLSRHNEKTKTRHRATYNWQWWQ